MPSPIVTATIQATILSAISNVLAQSIQAYRSEAPLELNPTPLLTFTLYALLSTPPNYLWQDLLESWFPSYPPPSSKEKTTQQPQQPALKLSKTNTIKKFLLDQSISAPLNSLFFLAFIKGSALAALPVATTTTTSSSQTAASATAFVLKEVLRDFPGLHLASLKLWPAVGIASFTLVPVERRVVFGSLVALGWNIYLGLVMG